MTSPPPDPTPAPGPPEWPVPPVAASADPVLLDDERFAASLPRAARPALPIVPTDYVRFFRTPRLRWWMPLVAMAATGVLWLVLTVAFLLVGASLDGLRNVYPEPGRFVMQPWTFLANNVSLAACIPLAWLFAFAVFSQRLGWLASVVGRFRWGWFARVLLAALPVWIVLIGVSFLLEPMELSWRDSSVFMIIAIVCTTPLQAAGEEYLFRGIMLRGVGAWFRDERLAIAVAGVVTAVAFMLLHGAGDLWLNLYYVVFGAVAAWLAWRTGGLEASIGIHVVNNVVSMAILPFTDLGGAFDRGAGVGSPLQLINAAVIVGFALVIDRLGRRAGLVTRTAPGREHLQRARAHALAARTGPPGVALP